MGGRGGRGRRLPFKATARRLEPLATEPTNEALSIVAGQREAERRRDMTLFSAVHESALYLFLRLHSPASSPALLSEELLGEKLPGNSGEEGGKKADGGKQGAAACFYLRAKLHSRKLTKNGT